MIEFKNLKDDGNYEVSGRVDLPHDTKCGSMLVQYTFCGECGNLLQPQNSEMIFDRFKKMVTDI